MKRCVCEHSSTFPLCDGSHVSEGWTCAAQGEQSVPMVFVASGSLGSLAERLAHRFGGAVADTLGGGRSADRLIVLTDGHDISGLHEKVARVDARERVLITVGIEPAVASWAFEGWNSVHIPESGPAMLWRAAETALEQVPRPASTRGEPPRVFLSHSVKDEGKIFEVIDTLRKDFGIPIFVCADSIASGTDWLNTIRTELHGCDLVLFLASSDANNSAFCAFEVGFASALGKPIHVVCLDASTPPLHLENLQAIQTDRLRARKPWLGASDALLEACLEALR
ncbi:MAG: TIR domain-containing protein [Myxococcota bacterium]|nr:TIR domain-containing protein [Myxococcota bacterium]